MPRVEGTYLDYKISDLDFGATTDYFGFINKTGGWYILKLTSTQARYCRGSSDYTTNWTNRTSLTYDVYSSVF